MKDISVMESLAKLFFALPVVILAAYLSLRMGSRTLKGLGGSKYLQVVETVQVYNKAALSVVRIGEAYHVLGVTEHSVQTIRELTREEVETLKKEKTENNGSISNKWLHSIKNRKGPDAYE